MCSEMLRLWRFALSLKMTAVVAGFLLTLLATRSSAAQSADSARAGRLTTPIILDGRTTDDAWQTLPPITHFLEYEPRTGADSRFRTEVRIGYDDRALYILARMHDPAPDSIISLLSRRDVRTPSEQLKLVIDSYHDRRTAYQFITNPAGVKRDFYVYNDNVEDQTWDAVWDVATAIDSLGWVAEFRIPLSQLRFPNADAHTFGLLIVRDVARTSERISWPLFRRDAQGYVSQGGTLTGLVGLPSPRRVELSPYAVTRNVTRLGAPGTRTTHPQLGTAGLDAKIGVSSNLTLDAAINPDFGQVEADPSVLNLSAFEQFFDERRPFFLEGAGIFSFSNDCEDVDSGCRGLFYSRRIGRAPQLGGLFGTPASPAQSAIAGAAKLTGRTARGLSVGVLDAVTPRVAGIDDRTIEPTSNYGVVRVQQDLANGQSGIGAMVTTVHRDLDSLTAPWLRRSALTGGIDARHRFGQRNYEVTLSLAASRVAGDTGAMRRLQTDGVHRYQRPDDALILDSTRTSLAGTSQRLTVSKWGGGSTRFQFIYQRMTPGFESNDLGFQLRADVQMMRGWYSIQLQQPTHYYRRAFFNFNASGSWSAAGLPIENWINTNGHLELPSQWWLHAGMTRSASLPAFDDREARGGPAVRSSPSQNLFLGVEGDRRKRLTPTVFVFGQQGDDGATRRWSISPSIDLRASSRFSASLQSTFSRERIGAQWLRNVGSADSARSLFATLDQTIFQTSVRLNLTATPTLSFQLWAQPFVTTGAYSNLARLSTPRARLFSDRFSAEPGDPGGFDFSEVRSNMVLRWEYRPGALVFLVWQHGRSRFEDVATRFDAGRDLRRLFALPPNNTILLKVSYWLNP